MVQRLVLLRIVVHLRGFAVENRVAVHPVFGNAQRYLGIDPVEFIQEVGVVLHFSVVPAIVDVMRLGVRDPLQFAVRQGGVLIGAGGKAVGIEFMGQIIQRPHTIRHPGLLAENANLVLHPPEADSRVMHVLQDHFLKLFLRVFQQGRFGCHLEHRNFRPDHESHFVTQIIHALRMRIVAQPDRIGPDFPDNGHILLPVLRRGRGKNAGGILMLGNPVQLQVCAVQEKSLLRIQSDRSEADPQAYFVQQLPVPVQRCPGCVKGRILQTVPAPGRGNLHAKNLPRRAFRLRCCLSVRIGQGTADLESLRLASDMGLRGDRTCSFLPDRGTENHPLRTKIGRVKPGVLRHPHFRLPVDPAEQGEIPAQRGYSLPFFVVHPNVQPVLSLGKGFRQLDGEAGISALMPADAFPVQIDFAFLVHPVKAEEYMLIRCRPEGKDFLINRVPLVGIFIGIPGMGQRHRRSAERHRRIKPFLRILRKRPSPVPVQNLFHRRWPPPVFCLCFF